MVLAHAGIDVIKKPFPSLAHLLFHATFNFSKNADYSFHFSVDFNKVDSRGFTALVLLNSDSVLVAVHLLILNFLSKKILLIKDSKTKEFY